MGVVVRGVNVDLCRRLREGRSTVIATERGRVEGRWRLWMRRRGRVSHLLIVC